MLRRLESSLRRHICSEGARVLTKLSAAITAFILVLVLTPLGHSAPPQDWPMYRHDALRTGSTSDPDLSDPNKVILLQVQHTFSTHLPLYRKEWGSFYASPIVVNNKVFIGSTAGYFYALDAQSLNLIWKYPPQGKNPLRGNCGKDSWDGGLKSSAAYVPVSST